MQAENEVRRLVAELAISHSQAAIAAAIGYSQSSVSRFLNGEQRLSLDLAGALRRAYPQLDEPLRRALLARALLDDTGHCHDPASAAAS